MNCSPGSLASSETSARSAPDCRQCDRCSRHESLLCRYAGKKCHKPRATKRNGSLHNLCDHHRIRANQNQRRMSHRIRVKQNRVHAAAASGRHPLHIDESAEDRRADWAWPSRGFDPRMGHFPIATTSTYFPSSPHPQFAWRDVSFTATLAGNELSMWKRPSAHESRFVDDFPWPELAPVLQHEGFFWSDHELLMGGAPHAMAYGSERANVV